MIVKIILLNIKKHNSTIIKSTSTISYVHVSVHFDKMYNHLHLISMWSNTVMHVYFTDCLCVHSMEEEGGCSMCIDTDSETAEKKDETKFKVKWTQEEVSEKTFNNCFPYNHY